MVKLLRHGCSVSPRSPLSTTWGSGELGKLQERLHSAGDQLVTTWFKVALVASDCAVFHTDVKLAMSRGFRGFQLRID
jgi:hypothetical protein